MTIETQLEQLYQTHSRRVLATLIRLLGDFDLAEEAMHEAFIAALQQWSDQGVPENPTAWLITAGRHKGIDQIRRRQTLRQHQQQLLDEDELPETSFNDESIEDDQLRLIFTCCHPSLATEAQLALTLREMCGLTTEQVAHGLLQKPTTLAQRIVRAKRKIRDAAIPYEVPDSKALPQRLQSVLQVIYLVFNEGYSSSFGESVVNHNLAEEAIRLGRILCELLPDTEVLGLLALMLLQDSRKAARQTAEGDLITLDEQDRALWDQQQILEGLAWLDQAMTQPPVGPYTLQAAIAALHAQSKHSEGTDWAQITGLYDLLLRINPSPVIELNRTVALAMRDGPEAGLQALQPLEDTLQNYYLLHAAKADFYRRLNRVSDARAAYQAALNLTQQLPEKRYLQRRLESL
ncbi:RNA polymerase sigma factor [Nitrincola sp. MINF-07-Sa-05]|uniref:RNA polymerase sigma factor n=1 Tax=Nitrincola salilacus TaxID=3400273 RepID=UPI003917CBA5